jgi:hypothetical protein
MACCDGKHVFIRGVAGVTKAVLRIGEAPASVIAARRDECRECPHAIKHPFKTTDTGLPLVSFCGLCRCALRLKTRTAGESCPDNPPRWGKHSKEAVKPGLYESKPKQLANA